ncbi:MAG: hypothetical protein K8E24_003930 [Methanobacterium paludis]|nr:hypothetical protein [Methanobacterium paludis]
MFEIIYQALDAVFGPLIYMDPNPNNPIFAIFIIATIVAFIITLARNSFDVYRMVRMVHSRVICNVISIQEIPGT